MAVTIGIDLGTSSTKTIALLEDGAVIASASQSYPTHTPHPGWVEQDEGDWWRAVCETCRDVMGQLDGEDVSGVSLSGHMNGAVFLDDRNRLLRPPILWLDRRSQKECDDANERAADLFESVSLQLVNPINTLAKVLWTREHEPDCYRDASTVLIPKDWIRFKLTDTIRTDVSDASVTAAGDLFKRDWSGDILDRLDVLLGEGGL